MIRTKYTYWAYLPLILALTLIPLLYVFIAMSRKNSPIILNFILSGILFLCVWFIVIELGKKVVSVSINEDTIKTVNFLGLGSSRTIKLNDIDGFKISSTPYDWERFEILYLIKDNKKVIRFSESYHKNYYELKDFFRTHFKNLGDENFNIFY